MYSFRPKDKEWPRIAITPASFNSLGSMDDMLNNIPYIVVKEYFFKNTASTMIDFVKKIMGTVQQVRESLKNDDSPPSNEDDKSSQGSADAKGTGNRFLDAVMKKFEKVELKTAAIDIPYILYIGLRRKQYGNTYIFPYIV